MAGATLISAQIHLPTFARLSQSDATARATQWLASMHPEVAGYELTSAYHADALTKVLDPSGYIAYKTSFPENDFVLWFGAPEQGGYKHISALIVVDALTGKIQAAQVRENN